MYFPALFTEIRRAAFERVRGSAPPTPRIRGAVAEGCDGAAVAALAALSGRTAPQGAVLFAELAGDAVAAIGIFDRHVVAHGGRLTLPLDCVCTRSAYSPA